MIKTKKCPHCKKVKNINLFAKSKNKKDGHNSWCKSCVNSLYKTYIKNPEVRKRRYENTRRWLKENEPKFRKKAFEVIANGKKIQCVKYKKWKCCCGQTDLRFLQLDHIEGGGYKKRKKSKMSGISFYSWIIKNPIEARKEFQILCSNANWIKKYENKEVANRK